MSHSGFANATSAIDPSTGQLVEMPFDQNCTYVIQDGPLIASTQLSTNSQGGKSLLKPELAQHLTQHGYKPTVGRGGFTVGSETRWAPGGSPRTNRNMPRKPLTAGSQVQPGTTNLSQSNTTLAPASTGVLSLGSRYTPSSASVFGGNVGNMNGGTLVTSGPPTTLLSTNVGVDRESNYRLAAAIAGTSGRGRPRGRRPLRGQFPVVPIDMVRQLGIEQQVILQPAAPVAMRNKAVLCRPLSMCRKTQVSVVQFEGAQETGLVSIDELSDSPVRKVPRQKISKSVSDTSVNTELLADEVADKRNSLDTGISTDPPPNCSDQFSQTDTNESNDTVRPKYIPIPIPIPIYLPTPVYLYARPVPYTLPFPLPCPIPFPIITKDFGEKLLKSGKIAETDVVPEFTDNLVDAEPISVSSAPPLETTSTVDESDHLVISTEAVPSEFADKKEACGIVRPSKRPASPLESSPVESTVTSETVVEAQSNIEHQPTTNSLAVESGEPLSKQAQIPPNIEPVAKKPRHTMVVSDANYHLKFSYGINAWRHWVQHKLASLGGAHSALVEKDYPHLRIELLNMSLPDLNVALSQFVREVRKPNGECYVADSIFYLCLGIQEYLNENRCRVNIFGCPVFMDFTKALDDILANFQPRINPEGLLVCRIEEEHLWEAQQLGHYSSEILLFTILYFNTKHLGLRHGAIHRRLAFWRYQFIDEPFPDNAALCHLSSSLYGTSDEEASATIRLDANTVHPERCPVKLLRTYCSQCPPSALSSEDAFYLTPVYPPDDGNNYWYSAVPMESSALQVMLNRIKMVKEIQEAFMNGQPDCGF